MYLEYEEDTSLSNSLTNFKNISKIPNVLQIQTLDPQNTAWKPSNYSMIPMESSERKDIITKRIYKLQMKDFSTKVHVRLKICCVDFAGAIKKHLHTESSAQLLETNVLLFFLLSDNNNKYVSSYT